MDAEEMKRVMERARQGTIEERLTLHALTCNEGDLLREAVVMLLNLRVQLKMAEQEIGRLEREQYRGQ
jgi:hypothetical protein